MYRGSKKNYDSELPKDVKKALNRLLVAVREHKTSLKLLIDCLRKRAYMDAAEKYNNSEKAIADHLGVHPSAVWHFRKDHGL